MRQGARFPVTPMPVPAERRINSHPSGLGNARSGPTSVADARCVDNLLA